MNKLSNLASSLILAVLMPALLLPLASCSRVSPKPNVLLITIDTLRADRLGCYGYEKVETPHIDALASRGALFTDANSHAPLTLPSHSSIMTGKIPPAHGVRDNGAYYLDDSQTTLAEVLSGQGYQTSAFISAFVLDSQFGIAQGFETYDDDFLDLRRQQEIQERIAGDTTSITADWLKANAGPGKKPFFTWVHYFDPHAAYAPPEPYLTQYADSLYDGEVAYVDEQFGRLVETLSSLNVLDNTLIVLTADHGESLGEHGEPTHGYFIYQSTIHVPLIFSGPGVAKGTRSVQYVTLSDVAPTILECLGLPPLKAIDGKSRVAILKGEGESVEDRGYAEAFYPRNHNWSDLLSYRIGDWKYIRAPKRELYNLKDDPEELNNLLDAEASKVAALDGRLRSVLDEAVAHAPRMEQRQMTEEQRIAMQQLGYVASGNAAADLDAINLPDVKDMIGTIDNMNKARVALLQEDATHCEQFARLTVEGDPLNSEGHFLLARALNEQQRHDEALISMKTVTEIQPTRPQAWYYLGSIFADVRRFEEAREAYEKAIELQPTYANAFGHLCGVLRELEDLPGSIRAGEKSIELHPFSPANLNQLGLSYYASGEYEKAHDRFVRAIEMNPDLADPYYNMALVYEKINNKPKAIEALEHALKVRENYMDAMLRAANLYLETGRPDDAQAMADRILQQDPNNAPAHLTLGRIAIAGKDYPEAAKNLETAIQIDPEYGAAYNDLAVVCLAVDPPDADRAVQLCRLAEEKGESVNPGLVEKARSMAGKN